MDAPFPSQASQTNLPQIFRNQDASSMQIFTEAGGIQGRPQLMRKLRGHGATICNDPKSAQLILVNPNTSQGRHFIRDWGNDESKVVLDYGWVKKCIEEGKALVADDDWGDYIARDDGLPIGEEDDESEIPNPLPTPRVTPVERKGSVNRVPEPVPYSSVPATQQTQRGRSTMPPPTASTSSSNTGLMSPMTGISQPMSPFNPMLPVNSMSQAQFPMQMAAMMNPMLMQQMFATMMMNQTGVQFNEETFKLALADTMKFSSNSQMQPPVYNQPGIPSPVQEQALPFPVVPSKPSHSSRRSISEFSDSPSLDSADRKGKQRAVSPSPKRRKISASPHPDTSHTQLPGSQTGNLSGKKIFVKSGRPLAFFVQIDLHNRFSVVDAIKKNGGKIEKDQDLADYIILYTTNKRHKTFTDLLRAAQLSAKVAVPSKYVHDCVERGRLLPAAQYEFDSIIHGKRKRQNSAVMASESDHEKDIQADIKRREKNERQSERRKERRLEQAAEAAAASQASRQAKPKKIAEAQIVSKGNVSDPAITGRRTPPIPGEHTRLIWGGGYRFPHAENEFALNYAQILIERDHTISSGSIASAIHDKLPHHTLKSWRTQFAKISQAEIDIWRKRASIAYRKALRQSQPGPSAVSEEPIDIQFSSSPVPVQESQQPISARSNGASHPPTPNGVSGEELKLLQEDDLNVISHFFANADENEDEDAVWAKLASSYRCQTETSWQKFYEEHFAAVQERHAEITNGAQ